VFITTSCERTTSERLLSQVPLTEAGSHWCEEATSGMLEPTSARSLGDAEASASPKASDDRKLAMSLGRALGCGEDLMPGSRSHKLFRATNISILRKETL